MQAVIICGGKGIRLKSVINNKPKALIKFNKIENLKNQIEILKKNGVKDYLFLVNNFENQIKNFLKKNYSKKFKLFKEFKVNDIIINSIYKIN
jgi:NDP-sugar pyrophosphorylase family protein|tara:strand:- start:377 stop:655 length:279 start_codon:yes stop_codon:yes gene_type:complete